MWEPALLERSNPSAVLRVPAAKLPATPFPLPIPHVQQHASVCSVSLHRRIASIFVILFGASVFGLLTLRFKAADAVFPRLLRAFSGGIILALALVHIIPEVRKIAFLSRS